MCLVLWLVLTFSAMKIAPTWWGGSQISYTCDHRMGKKNNESEAKSCGKGLLFMVSGVWKLTYPSITTTLTEEQCASILKPLLATGLPAVGIMRNFSQAVIHGPHDQQGLQFPNLQTVQMVQQIMTLLGDYKNSFCFRCYPYVSIFEAQKT